MTKFLLYFSIFFSFILLLSCNKEKLKAPTASFLVSGTPIINLTTAQGSNSQNITDLWFYVDGKFQGCYPVGGIMPMVAKNNAKITVYGGIKNNGIKETRVPYPFYTNYETNLTIEAGKTYTIIPQFSYLSNVAFAINDNFEASGSQFTAQGDSFYFLTANPSLTYGGIGKSVFMSMSDAKPTAKMITSSSFGLPLGGTPIYVELDYKCNQQFTIGVRCGGQEERDAIVVTPQSSWKKIYIQLNTAVSTPPTYIYYDLYIKASKEVASPEILIDNVKLIAQ
jgi:hypothetical protein